MDLQSSLRQKRRTYWQQAAISTQNHEDAIVVCRLWSQHADELLTEAFDSIFLKTDAIALFALGKLGSMELNLSSDVDLLFVAESLSQDLQKKVRDFTQALSQATAEGFVFRVDYDLRPGGRMSALVPTVDQYVDYYSNFGETWERLALLRMRYVAGSKQVRKFIEDFNARFIFRRHLDYRIFEDLKKLRFKIQDHRIPSHSEGSIHLKLTPGGIRDIELFAQSWIVIHGGKNSALRRSHTIEILQDLAKAQLLPQETSQFLQGLYKELRALENYVQSIDDQQTHTIDLQNLSKAPAWVLSLSQTLPMSLQRSSMIVSELLGDFDPKKLFSSEDQSPTAQLSPEVLIGEYQEILSLQGLGKTSPEDESMKRALLAQFLSEVSAARGNLDLATRQFLAFLKSIRAKKSFFHLLLRENKVLQELAWLFGHSPYLSRILIYRPELLDSFIYRVQDLESQDWDQFLESLAEKRLLAEIINGSEFLRGRNLSLVLQNCTSVADEICLRLLSRLNQEYNSSVDILCLGKWGSRELGLQSDLDFIFTSPQDPTENDYKVARRFVSRVTEAHRGGALFNIDLRLRPSGKAGPLVVSEQSLSEYLKNEAPAWQRQAFLRARPLGKEETLPSNEWKQKGLSSEELAELGSIQNQLYRESQGELDLKKGPGGLLDIELCTQTLALQNSSSLASSPLTTEEILLKLGAPSLAAVYHKLRSLEQEWQLVNSSAVISFSSHSSELEDLAHLHQCTSAEIVASLRKLLAESQELLKSLDPRPRSP